MPSSSPHASSLSLLRGAAAYVIAVLVGVGWPVLLRLKVLPVFAHAAGSRTWGELLDAYGSALLGVIASLALGDFLARRHPGRAAYAYGGIAFGVVFAISLGFSVFSEGSFIHVYELLWPPHGLFALAGIWLGQRARFRQLSLYAGMLFWLVALLSALSLGVIVEREACCSVPSWKPSMGLLVTCAVISLAAVTRLVMGGRKLLRRSA